MTRVVAATEHVSYKPANHDDDDASREADEAETAAAAAAAAAVVVAARALSPQTNARRMAKRHRGKRR